MRIAKFALVMSLALLSACMGLDSIRGSGTIKTETRTVHGFTGIGVSGDAKVTIEQGDTESLSITADDNLLEQLTSDVENSELRLGSKSNVSVQPSAPIIYKITLKKLNSLSISGSVVAEARGVHTDSLNVAVSGSGNISVSGDADQQMVDVSGSADYKADSFKTKSASVNISGSGKAIIAASDKLDVQVSGSGNVQYIGSPKITNSISGSGSVKAWAQ